MAISSDFSSLSRGGDTPKEKFQGQGAKITRDKKGTLQASRGADYVGAGTTKASAAGDRMRASSASSGKRGNYSPGTAPSVGGSYTPSYSGPKGKVSYGNSSALKKK